MSNLRVPIRGERSAGIACLVVLLAAGVALVSAQPYAGSWNDGSRLAAVESIVDRGTTTIDDSIFVQVPTRGPLPYPADDMLLLQGTRDKLLIQGHYYSDKPYLISFLMAGIYRTYQAFGLPTAAERPDLFCWWMTVSTSGIAYVLAVWSLFSLGAVCGLFVPHRLALSASLALATVALPYTRHVNNHIMFLGVASALVLQLAYLAQEMREVGRSPWYRPLLLGTLAGIAYPLDLGVGPVLLVCLFPLLVYRWRRFLPLLLFAAAVAPWLLAHHVINYVLGGVLKPMNAVPEYLAWPGSPFTPENLTGLWRHGPLKFLVYSLALQFGKLGFLFHNLPVLLAIPCWALLLRRPVPQRPELIFGLAWFTGSWLLYSMFSNNYGGACCSVRWFVPLLAPAYYALAVQLGRCDRHCADFFQLSLWGGLLAGIMWWYGPWIRHMVPLYWPIVAAALLSWFACRQARHREQIRSQAALAQRQFHKKAA